VRSAQEKSIMIHLDLFSGIGGFALGAKRSGMVFDKHLYSEIDPFACKVYQKHFPNAINLGDIKQIKTEVLPYGKYIITGGFPCQDLSIAGKKKGLQGERSGLWYEMQRLIRETRPEFCIIENVGRLAGNGLETILRFFDEIGYNVSWQTIQAWEYGAPHRRERLYIVADASSERFKLWSSDWERRLVQKNKERAIAESEQKWNGRKYRIGKTFQVDDWKRTSSDICRMDDGFPNILDKSRLKALGNALIVDIAEDIFTMLFPLAHDVRVSENSANVI